MAGNDAGILPMDVVYDILLHVPTRPLCRFRAVCQSWRSLLSDDAFFTATHAARHRGNDPPLFAVAVAGGTHGEVADINLLDTSGRVVKRVGAGSSTFLRQVCSHKDLVLTRRITTGSSAALLHVLDPATGAATLLPDDGGYECSYAFGRVTGDGEYKVLSLSRLPLLCKVLTVDGHGEWRYAWSEPPAIIEKFDSGRTAVADGVVYHLMDDDDTGDDGWAMAAFDLAAEEWQPYLLEGPAAEGSIGYGGSTVKKSLAEVNGRLAAVCTTVSTMDVWLLMGAGDGEQALWWKQHTLLTTSIRRRHGIFPDVEPLWVLDDGRVAVWVYSSRPTVAAGLWMYDPSTETFTEVGTMNNCLKIGVGVYTGSILRLTQRAQDK